MSGPEQGEESMDIHGEGLLGAQGVEEAIHESG